MKKDRKFTKHGTIISRNIFSNLRVSILIFFIAFCIIIVIYHFYFESPISNDDTYTLPELSETKSKILKIENESESIQFSNPSLAINDNGFYLLSFETFELNGSSKIQLINSNDGELWTIPQDFKTELIGAKNPMLEYVKEKNFMIIFEIDGKSYFSLSTDGKTWNPSEPWEHDVDDMSVHYTKDYILAANQTGLWRTEFNEKATWVKIIDSNFTNPAILEINEFKYIIVSDNPNENWNSIKMTSVNFKKPSGSEMKLKWELLLLFLILGLFLLGLTIHEVAKE